MRCLECGSEAVTERPERTAQGYRRFRCRTCGKQFDERSDTLLNRTQYPSDVIALVVLWRLRQRGAGIKGAAALTPAPPCSGDADVVRASQVQHAIEHVGGDVHLGRPTLIRMRAQPVADHLLPSADRSLGPGAFRVPGRPLPSHAPVLGDVLEM